MKKVILLPFWLICMSSILHAQQHSYHSIFENQAQWDLKVLDYGSGLVVPVSQYVQKDTIISGQGFVIFQENTSSNVQKGMIIKEDEDRGKVYVVENGQSYLLYDFTLEKGDKFSFKDLDFEVIAVKELKLLDSKRKMIELRCGSKLADNMVWIEGVGSTIAPLYYKDYGSSVRNVKVACFFKGHNLEYSLSDQPCSKQLNSFTGKEKDLDIRLSPNPFDDHFTINIDNPSDGKVLIKIYDLAGQIFYQEEMHNPGQRIDKNVVLEGIDKGIYFLNICTEQRQITRKIIKI